MVAGVTSHTQEAPAGNYFLYMYQLFYIDCKISLLSQNISFIILRFGEYLVFKKGGRATCETKRYCKRFDNWHWWEPHQRCYRQFTQGPCKKGKSFDFNI